MQCCSAACRTAGQGKSPKQSCQTTSFTYTAVILILYLSETYLHFLHNSYLHSSCVPGILGSASCAFFLPAVLSVVGDGQCPAEMEENRHYLSLTKRNLQILLFKFFIQLEKS